MKHLIHKKLGCSENPNINQNVLNLSSSQLSMLDLSVLSYGFDYCIPPTSCWTRRLLVQSWLQASNNTGILNTCTWSWLTDSEQVTPVDSIKVIVWSSVKVSEFDKHLKKTGGHISQNVVEITIKMKTIVWKHLMIKTNVTWYPTETIEMRLILSSRWNELWQAVKEWPSRKNVGHRGDTNRCWYLVTSGRRTPGGRREKPNDWLGP